MINSIDQYLRILSAFATPVIHSVSVAVPDHDKDGNLLEDHTDHIQLIDELITDFVGGAEIDLSPKECRYKNNLGKVFTEKTIYVRGDNIRSDTLLLERYKFFEGLMEFGLTASQEKLKLVINKESFYIEPCAIQPILKLVRDLFLSG